jgi:uncharacterized protein (DUF2141 family)
MCSRNESLSMKSGIRLSLIGMLIAWGLSLGALGCGGGHPSPPITVSVSPVTVTVQPGGMQQFTATVSNDPSNRGVSWTMSPPTGAGTLSGVSSTSATYNAPASPASALSVTIKATAVADTTKLASAAITVPATITVSLSPATATLQPGGTQQFTATVTNDPSNRGVTWTISPPTGAGTLSGASSTSVTYSAPATAAGSLNLIITATSMADPSKSATAKVTIVTPAISVGISPASALEQVTGTVPFDAGVGYDPNNAGVTWSVGGCTGGASVCGSMTNINNSGPFTADYVAPATVPPGGQVSVVATSVTDPTKSASASVTISPINFTSQNYPAGNSPDGVAVADFNGDGKLDIAVADYGNPSTGDNGGVSILLGNGDGTFQQAKLIGAGKNPISIAIGDFNNDGKQDLVVTDFGDRSSGGNGNVAVLLGNGDGTFQPPTTLTAGPEPFVLAPGDFNNDGNLDLAVTDFSAGVYLSLGNGDGTFQPPVLFSTGNSPSAMAAHDFNGDGKLDLAVAGAPLSGFNSTVSILLSKGDGTFAQAVPYVINEFLPTSIATGDLTGSGKMDLAITTHACVLDVCRAPIQILFGNGDGTFQPSQQLGLPVPATSNVELHPPGLPLSLNTADFRGDGKADLVEVIGPYVALFPGNGDGTFEGVLLFGADRNPYALAIGDFKGDGKPDIVVANQSSNDITVLLNATAP